MEPNKIISCKNCGTEFEGNFCPNCGQSVREFQQPFSVLVYDLFGTVFAFDTRFWKTLKAVVFQPGKMADDFMQGRRVRYMPPFRFYVFVSFIFFLLLNTISHRQVDHEASQKLAQKLAVSIEEESDFEDSLALAQASTYDTSYIDYLLSDETTILVNSKPLSDDDETFYVESIRSVFANPDPFLDRFLQYFSWALFVMLPLYAFLLWLFFHKKYRYYFGHLIVAINQHAFVFLILSIIFAVNLLWPDKSISPEMWLLLLIPVYLLWGTKKLFKRGWPLTFFRLATVSIIYFFSLVTVVLVVMFHTIF